MSMCAPVKLSRRLLCCCCASRMYSIDGRDIHCDLCPEIYLSALRCSAPKGGLTLYEIFAGAVTATRVFEGSGDELAELSDGGVGVERERGRVALM